MGLCSSKKNIKKAVDDSKDQTDQPKQIFNPIPAPLPSDSTPNPFGDSPNDEGLDQFDENGLPMRRSQEKEKYDDRDDISSVTSGSRAVTSPRFQRRFVRHSTEDSKNDGTPRKASIGGAMLTPQKSLSDSSKSGGGGGGTGSVNPEDLPFTKIGMMEKQGKRLKSFSERFFTLKEGTKIYILTNI